MVKKKTKVTEKEHPKPSAAEEIVSEDQLLQEHESQTTEAVINDLDNPQDPAATYQAEITALNEKYLRLYSEFDNYRKRTVRERADLIKTASSGLITQLLPVMDDFERATASFETTTNIEALKEGIALIFNKLKKTLEHKGLEAIESIGEPFNTDLHEAITNIPASSEEMRGKVAEEIEKGYMLNGTVIRFAKVAVAN